MTPTYSAYEDLNDSQAAVDAVLGLLEEVERQDGVAPLGEAFIRGITHDQGHRHIIAIDGEIPADSPDPAAEPQAKIVGILAIDEADSNRTAEVAVLPSRRHSGIAAELFKQAAHQLKLKGPIDVWAHGDLASAQSFVANLDARRTRELLKMAVDIPLNSLRREQFEEEGRAGRRRITELGFEVLNYPESVDRYGQERVDEEWVRVNNEAFAWHPEQGGWDVNRLKEARDTDWFDPAGVLFLWGPGEAEGDQCLGFHWTKIPSEEHVKEEGERAGEVYVVCLADTARGKGLGGPITMVGVAHLLSEGVGVVELYVEGDNAPAVATYRKLGFEVVHTDVVYRGILKQ